MIVALKLHYLKIKGIDDLIENTANNPALSSYKLRQPIYKKNPDMKIKTTQKKVIYCLILQC